MAIRTVLTVMAAAVALAACSENPEPATRTEQTLTVQGTPEGIARFAALQEAQHPALRTSTADADEPGKRKLVVHLPEDYTGAQLGQLTREVLAAGLSYEYRGETVTAPHT